jgi:hypothetical protein
MAEMKKERKAKSSEPSLLDQLNGPLKDIVNDFKENGATALETVRARNPEKYLELATKLLPLIVSLNPGASDFSKCHSMQDIGTRLLQSIGLTDPTDEQIAEAIKVNDDFIARLERISLLGQMETGEPN